MKTKKDNSTNINFIEVPPSTFVQEYNKNIPDSFPQASLRILQKFKETYPSLFKDKSEWTIDKHRKKLMDWLASHHEK
ncbi:hypothetical protein KJ991_01550 [Patescibacteria group bacterium]|nr:hypothetical protein [Patescibacteria group bacterium]MBU4057782.1 hypothetical protein [Patescibacteria group bacterium]MBU4115761.1 hypothetical protein [Patescibacteria group bacterium]